MPDITISLTDQELSAGDITLIKSSLGLPTDTDMEPVWPILFKSALLEYIKMFKEGGMPGRAAEAMQERLYFLIIHYFHGIPDENIVESIFQVTSSQSKTLLRNTQSRYRTRITDILKQWLHQILEGAVPDGTEYYLDCVSEVAISEMNKIIRLKGSSNSQIYQQRGTSSRYRMRADTYDLLQDQLG